MHKTDSTLHSHSHTRAYMLSTMDAAAGLVTGSHNALLVIQHHEEPKPFKNADGPDICEICGDDVGFTVDGEIFVACDECGFPVCRPCYEYERREGSQLCPQCKTRYKRIKGSPRVVGDEDEEDVDDIEQEFKMQDEQHLHKHAEALLHRTISNRSVTLPTTKEKVQEPTPENSYPKREHTLSSLQRGQILHFASEGNERWDERKEGAKKERITDWKLQQGNIWSETDCSLVPEKATGEESRQPLSRKIPMASGNISPYRMVVAIRLVVLVLFLHYRVTHPVHDAKGIWLTSVICEIWLALSWIIDQLPKWFPIGRQTYLERLSLRYEPENKPNLLSPVDIFVNAVDPMKEPPLVTANTILSILAIDYPIDKISCYVSDDGASFLTFEVLSETAEFSRKWVPFCRKYATEPRAPEKYFSEKMNYLKDKVRPTFVKDRRTMKREYEEFKVRINALVAKAMRVPQEGWTLKDGTPWPGNNAKDHPCMIQVFLGDSGELDAEGKRLPRLVYVSREKRPGFHHYNKAGALNALLRVSAVLTNAPFVLNLDCNHYVNNSKALREAMCFLMDLQIGNQVCFVQFPLRFEGIDKHDRYANRNTVFFDITLKGLDGIQGPTYVGTGCVFRRRALYGFEPKEVPKRPKMVCCPCFGARRKLRVHSKQGGNGDDSSILEIEEENQTLTSNMKFDSKYGESVVLVASTLIEESGIRSTSSPEALLKEAIQVISCGYEDRTEWGNEIGWMYGSITEDTLTGLKMHCRGWRSIYCMPKRPAFEGTASINLSDRLNQVLLGAIGSIEIFFSTHCPAVYGCKEGKLRWLQRLAYIGRTTYPFTSLPLLIYCVLPAVCLLTDKFIMPSISTFGSLVFIALFMSIFATGILEMRWSGVSLEEWWRDEQFWVIGSVSAHLFAIVQGLLKVVTGIDTNIMLTSNASKDEKLGELYTIKWTGLLIPPTTIVIINIVGIVAGITDAINSGARSWGALLGKLLFAIWVIVHLYPFLKGLTGRQNRTPTLVIIWSVLLASIFSLLWVRIDPFVLKTTGPDVKQCGINC